MDAVDRLIQLALEEDLGTDGDVTTRALVPKHLEGTAIFVVKEAAVVAGTDVAGRVFAAVDPEIRVQWRIADGATVEARDTIGEVRGRLASLLVAERTALNFLQRLCGIATATRAAVKALGGAKCRLLDTRKTAPGMRALEKAAVRAGGGANHRFGLFDGVLVKDNHLRAVGSVAEAVRRARAGTHHLPGVEVEVTGLHQLDQALQAGADIVLLDNFDDAAVAEAVRRCAGRARVEVSGGVTLERLPRIAASGADYVSMGALTHSARAVDISLEFA